MDWTETIVAIIIASLGSSGFFGFIVHILDIRNGQRDKLEAIEKMSREAQLALVRLQLLNLIQHTPSRSGEILALAHRYFSELGGNWYMESIFIEWAADQEIPLPAWFTR